MTAPDPIDIAAVVAVTVHPKAAQEESILDVHPPHEPVHGWRDFLLHLSPLRLVC